MQWNWEAITTLIVGLWIVIQSYVYFRNQRDRDKHKEEDVRAKEIAHNVSMYREEYLLKLQKHELGIQVLDSAIKVLDIDLNAKILTLKNEVMMESRQTDTKFLEEHKMVQEELKGLLAHVNNLSKSVEDYRREVIRKK